MILSEHFISKCIWWLPPGEFNVQKTDKKDWNQNIEPLWFYWSYINEALGNGIINEPCQPRKTVLSLTQDNFALLLEIGFFLCTDSQVRSILHWY